jgi:hypothetical protein
MIKTSRYKGLLWGSFIALEIDIILGDGVGASLEGFALYIAATPK